MEAKCNKCRHKNFCATNYGSRSCPDYSPIYEGTTKNVYSPYGPTKKGTTSGYETYGG